MRRRFTGIFSRKPGNSLEKAPSSSSPTDLAEMSEDPVWRVFRLPVELQGAILIHLDEQALFNLRLTSKRALQMVKDSESVIVRSLWEHRRKTTRLSCFSSSAALPCLCSCKPELVSAATIPRPPTFDTYHRLKIRDSTLATLAETFAQLLQTDTFVLISLGFHLLPTQKQNLLARLHLALVHLDHYWELCQNELEKHIQRSEDLTVERWRTATRKIVLGFGVPCLVECHGVFALLIFLLRQCSSWTLIDIGTAFMCHGLERLVLFFMNENPVRLETALPVYPGKLSLILKDYFLASEEKTAQPPLFQSQPRLAHAANVPIDLARAQYRIRQVDVDVRRKLYNFLSTMPWSLLTAEVCKRLRSEIKKDISRSPPDFREYVSHAMRFAPQDLDYEKIQEDWSVNFLRM